MQINSLTSSKANRGFSLIEMLIYIGVLTIVLLLVVDTTLAFTKSYKEVAALRAADYAGIDALERITREIRTASSIDIVNSTFGVSPGTLTLNEFNTSTKFYLQNNIIHMTVNGSYVGPLTSSSTRVTSLVFNVLSTTTSAAIKIDMTIEGKSGQTVKTKHFHSTIVLKGF